MPVKASYCVTNAYHKQTLHLHSNCFLDVKFEFLDCHEDCNPTFLMDPV